MGAQLLWNQYLDEGTRLLVQLEQIAHQRDAVGISGHALKECSLYEKTIYTQLGGIQEKMQVTNSCLKAAAAGRHDEAERMMSLYSDLGNVQQDRKQGGIEACQDGQGGSQGG